MANEVPMRIARPDLAPSPRSVVEAAGATWGMASSPEGLVLVVAAPPDAPVDWARLEGQTFQQSGETLLVGPRSPRNAAALRHHLPWLAPQPVGLATSAGLGDRLGLATPGHALAVRDAGGSLRPVFAQQSMREMARTGRTPRQVFDDAMWGAFEVGWRDPMGADADHLKTAADIDVCAEAGFTWFTIDPGEYVDASADQALPCALKTSVAALPWEALADTETTMARRYVGATVDLEGWRLSFDDETFLRAAAKYGRMVARVAELYRHVAGRMGAARFDFEVSVDETDTPTSAAEHVFVARELSRLGVHVTSLAPRLVGRLEKGVDYIGDLTAFETSFGEHAAIARRFGPYKLSLHSGSDKFRIYPIVARHARGLVHLKTAGTTYLEGLRTVAHADPALFRAIYEFARSRYDDDRASYHVSATVPRAPDPTQLADEELPLVLDQFDARQILHVTFGSVATAVDDQGQPQFARRLRDQLEANRTAYWDGLRAHFARHLQPFTQTA